jgi:hypothetical protein
VRAAAITLAVAAATLLAGCGAKDPDPASVIERAQRASQRLQAPVATFGERAAGYGAYSLSTRMPGLVVLLYGAAVARRSSACAMPLRSPSDSQSSNASPAVVVRRS